MTASPVRRAAEQQEVMAAKEREMQMKTTWKRSEKQYSNGSNLFAGRWHVGSVFYDGISSKEQKNRYRATCNLPGIKELLGNYFTEEEAQLVVEKAVVHWMKGIHE